MGAAPQCSPHQTNRIEREIMKEQLARIKLLYLQAQSHAEKTDEINLILLVQILDFVIETFLKLVIHNFPRPQTYSPPQSGYYNKITHLQNTPYSPKLDFFRAWDEVVGILQDSQNKLLKNDLPLRRDMQRLHEIRNDIQHKLAIPNAKDANKYIPLVESFLENCYQDIFDVDYQTISYLSLIEDQKIRDQLEKAHKAFEAKDWKRTAVEAAIAFEMLLELAKTIAKEDPFFTSFFVGSRAFGGEHSELRRLVERTVDEIGSLREHLLIIACGMNYVQYLRYQHIAPKASLMSNGEHDVFLRKEDYSEEEGKFILTFVETQVLQFQTSGIYRDLADQIRKDRGY